MVWFIRTEPTWLVVMLLWGHIAGQDLCYCEGGVLGQNLCYNKGIFQGRISATMRRVCRTESIWLWRDISGQDLCHCEGSFSGQTLLYVTVRTVSEQDICFYKQVFQEKICYYEVDISE